MKIKNIVMVLLVTTVMASCAPAAIPVLPTQSPVPTNTSTKVSTTPAPSSTPEDTTAKDYLAETENIFPIKEVEGLGEFFCTADFSNFDYQVYTVEDGTTKVYTTLPCTDGGIKFVVPSLLTNKDISFTPLALNASQSIDGSDFNWFGNAPESFMKQLMDVLKVNGEQAKIRILIGTNTTSILKYADPFPRVFAGTQWDEGIKKFMQTGNPKDLPNLPGKAGYLLPTVRITITEPN